MGRDAHLRQSADELERVLARQRQALAEVAGDEERRRRAEAIRGVEHYASLLRKATAAESAREQAVRHRTYLFKLEFPDGRWDVEERRLDAAPAIGDVVDLAGHGKWRIRGSQLVRSRPSRKPPRTFFVCAPAA